MAQAKLSGVISDPNPEGIKETQNNSLFGTKQGDGHESKQSQTGSRTQTVKRKQAPSQADPAAQLVAKRAKSQHSSGSQRHEKTRADKGQAVIKKDAKHVRKHAEAVRQSTQLWEKIRADGTEDTQV